MQRKVIWKKPQSNELREDYCCGLTYISDHDIELDILSMSAASSIPCDYVATLDAVRGLDIWRSTAETLPKMSGKYAVITKSLEPTTLYYSFRHRKFNCVDECSRTDFEIECVAWATIGDLAKTIRMEGENTNDKRKQNHRAD